MSKELADRLKQALKTRGANQRQLAVVDEVLGIEKKTWVEPEMPSPQMPEVDTPEAELELDDKIL